MFKTYFWAVFFLGQLTFQTPQANEALSEELEPSLFFDKQVMIPHSSIEIGSLQKPKPEFKREILSPLRTSAETLAMYLNQDPYLFRATILTNAKQNRWDIGLRKDIWFALSRHF